jgi:hypothetical protein
MGAVGWCLDVNDTPGGSGVSLSGCILYVSVDGKIGEVNGNSSEDLGFIC